jgi:16S rRNA processing protein RimM
VLLKLAGYPTRTEAEALRGMLLQVHESEAVPLAEGEYFLYQLVGLQVFTEDGAPVGRLSEVLETGANNVFVVDGPRKQYLIPDIPDVVREIDLEEGRVVIHAMPGLIDDQ